MGHRIGALGVINQWPYVAGVGFFDSWWIHSALKNLFLDSWTYKVRIRRFQNYSELSSFLEHL